MFLLTNAKVFENSEMSDASEAELLLVSEPTGNEEKKTLFFFGQAGCLKLNSPVKTTENHNNHKKDDASSSSAKDSSAETSKQKDDEDEDNLLQKISEALKDETAQTLPVEKIDTSSLSNYRKFLSSFHYSFLAHSC